MKPRPVDKRIYTLLIVLLILTLVIFIGKLFAPSVSAFLLDIMWFLLLATVISFLGIGVLVMFGLKKRANQLLELYVEGSLTILDLFGFIKDIIELFIQKVKEFFLYVAPFIGYIISALAYFGLIVFYKIFGKTHDVTLVTLALSVVLIAVVGLFTLPNGQVVQEKPKWLASFLTRIKDAFSDGFEIVIFLFFLTMDNINLFFLPEALRVPMHAKLFNFDLMIRGYSLDHTQITINLVAASIVIEILRLLIRLLAIARKYYKEELMREDIRLPRRLEIIKTAVRRAFQTSKDELIKFITFTTILLLVFLLFPRLKLVSLVAASFTALVLDMIFPQRLQSETGKDLISRILVKVFKL